jgi:tetratricopeptide (TPR) repeat protein
LPSFSKDWYKDAALSVDVAMRKTGRNDPCHCGSGKKYKRCCMARDAEAASASLAAAAIGVLPLHNPRFCEDCNDKLQAQVRMITALVSTGKLDEAEQASHEMLQHYPDLHEGHDCLGMIAQARGDHHQAAEAYRKVIAIAAKEPSFYRSGFTEHYRDLIARLEQSPPTVSPA